MDRRGFTLIEVLLVVIILGLIAGMIVPRVVGRAGDARIKIATTDIEGGIAEILDLYEMDNGKYPATLQDLIEKPSGARSWNGPYLKKKTLPADPWGNPYVYRFPGSHNTDGYDLSSAGPDGAEGTEDDVNNWK